jgi:hypothetical protein
MNLKFQDGRMAEWQKVNPEILRFWQSAILQFILA